MYRHRSLYLPFPVRPLALLVLGSALLCPGLLGAPAGVSAQATPLPSNRGFATVQEIMNQSCVGCHSWARSYEGITDPQRITPHQPEASPLYLAVESDYMPLEGPKLTGAQKGFLRAWIEAGATAREEPLTVAGAEPGAGGEPEAAAAAPASGRRAGTGNLMGRINYHKVAGYTSAALLLGAGAVGTAKIFTFMNDGHAFRDASGIDDEEDPAVREEFNALWNSSTQQTLRWTHVGLLTAGNLLYLGNAITGLTFPPDPRPGLTPRRIHRIAFYAHASLMAANIVMGFLTTSALENGNHEQHLAFAITHAAIGVAIPLVMIGSGIAVSLAQ